MNDAQILTVVDSSTSLDDVCGERTTNLSQSRSDSARTLLMDWIVNVDRERIVGGNEVTHKEIQSTLVLNIGDSHYLQPETAHQSPLWPRSNSGRVLCLTKI
jgi:hypothetical protein